MRAAPRSCIWAQYQVVQVSGFGVGGPDRQPVQTHDGLDGGAEVAMLAGLPGIDRVAFDAGAGRGQLAGGEQPAVKDHMRPR